MRHAIALAVAAGMALTTSATTASAQSRRWSFEGRLNVTVPLNELSDSNAESGLGLGADVFYTFASNLSAYGGLSRHSFGCDGADCDDITSTGIQAGIKYLFGAERDAMPWLRGGLMLHKAEMDGADSDFGLGAEAGVGIDLLLRPRFALTPALRYHAWKADFGDGSLDMSYLTISLGAHFHF